jgi:hypothetical protein
MRLMDDSIPFAKGGELMVDIPVDARCENMGSAKEGFYPGFLNS